MRTPLRIGRHQFLALLLAIGLPALAAHPNALEQSKKEKGVVIYGNVSPDNFQPVLTAFAKKYPWISVKVLDMGPAPAFERYFMESSVGHRSADVIAAASPPVWIRFIKRGELEPYNAEGAQSLPEWSRPFPGLYTLATDPMVMVYNKLLLPPERQPKSIAQLRALVKSHPKDFANRLTTYDALRHPFAYAIHWTYARQRGEGAWQAFKELGPLTRPEGGGASMMEKVAVGDYTASYFSSPLTFFKLVKDMKTSPVLAWSLIEDGTPVMMRGIGITKKSQSKYSAQLFIDFVISREGQLAAARGGMTPYRSDIRIDEVPFLTYDAIRERIGDKNIILIKYDERMVSEMKSFTDRWRAAYKFAREDD
jgi:iron(III) transport system substrate-binding protein